MYKMNNKIKTITPISLAVFLIGCNTTNQNIYSGEELPLPPDIPTNISSTVPSPRLQFGATQLLSPNAEDTNTYLSLNFAWDWNGDTNTLDRFILRFGGQTAVYTNLVLMGKSNSFTLSFTNWNEIELKHYFVATARNVLGVESAPSEEVTYPSFAPDRFTISWITNYPETTIYYCSNLNTYWSVLDTVYNTNSYLLYINTNEPFRFFTINHPEALHIKPFNPLNSQR